MEIKIEMINMDAKVKPIHMSAKVSVVSVESVPILYNLNHLNAYQEGVEVVAEG